MDDDPRLDQPDKPEGTGGADRPPPPPPDRPGSPGQPSRAESRAAARTTDKPPEERTETSGKSETAEPAREQGEQKPQETPETESLLERMPSHSGFANLAEEFDARRASREAAQGNGVTNEQSSEITNGQSSETGRPDKQTAELDDDAIKEQIDPFAPDLSKSEGRKETFEQTARDSDAEWTDGVDRVEDLPTGEDLAEQSDNAPKTDRFRRTGYENLGTIKGRLESATDAVDKALGPRPTGHAETRADGPVMAEPPHSGVDAGSAASAMLAAGILGAEALRWVRGKINERGTDESDR
ncbi:hypothetical protein [Actinomadura decatromicini]|uniref:Uncharacterized protein n=1 Tax=Actinomadura decatromicini TaxID=2604572 RepID=A0A5D3FH04_9ACTN|nr:hypothetical protein [Actinomadura decatromicini]TYK47120.1 hypothetical protein FXF68_25270 [Actinomadura decatromicini]